MKELQPASEKTLMNLATLDKGMAELKAKQEFRQQFREANFKDPSVTFHHPKDGMIVVSLDDKLIAAMNGGILGAFRELESEGFGSIAREKFDEARKGGIIK